MMSDLFTRMAEFGARLLSGGTLEIVLLVVIIIVGLILLLVALWITWKLLVLLAKGLLWVARAGSDATRKQAAARREARLAAPPPVATGWGASPKISLRQALAQARQIAGPDGLKIVIVAGEGMAQLCRGIGIIPPGAGTIGIAAGNGIILIDAARVEDSDLKRFARALPWHRPMDAMCAVASEDVIPSNTLMRSARIARATGFRTALHIVFADTTTGAAWRITDAQNRDGATLCAGLTQDAARAWLTGGSREGMKSLAVAQSRELPTAIDRLIAAAPSSVVDFTAVCFGGAGLRAATAQTTARTQPSVTMGVPLWTGFSILALGIGLSVLAIIDRIDQGGALDATVHTARFETTTPWVADGIETLPEASRMRRMTGLAVRMSGFADFAPLAPLKGFIPNASGPEMLGAALMDGYVLRPLALSLARESEDALQPLDDPAQWLDKARQVDEWLAAWEGLRDEPGEVDIRRLLSAAFGGEIDGWGEGTDIGLIRTAVKVPTPAQGGLDVDGLTELAQNNFVTTMQRWAESVYTNGSVATAARTVARSNVTWHDELTALRTLRSALEDPGQRWLTAARDRPDYGFELRILGRAIALGVIGQGTALEAKASVSAIRIDARDAVEHFIVPGIGPLMVRASSSGGGSGPSLSLSEPAIAWLRFLEKVDGAGFANLGAGPPALAITGPVTVDPARISGLTEKLRKYESFTSTVATGLPPGLAEKLFAEVGDELGVALAGGSERALRPAPGPVALADQQAMQLAKIGPAIEQMGTIAQWLQARGETAQAERVRKARARAASTVLEAATAVLNQEDPIGLYIDPTGDRRALVRRFERGVDRLRRLNEQLGAPYVDAAAQSASRTAYAWRHIANDLAAYDRGDTDAALTGLSGMVNAFANDLESACKAPRARHGTARDDYVAEAVDRFIARMDYACTAHSEEEAHAVYDQIAQHFTRDIAWLWPYSNDPDAPEITAVALKGFIERLNAAGEDLAKLKGGLAEVLNASARFWQRDDKGSVVVTFRFDWRTRPSEEAFAEHVIDVGFNGIESDEDGVYTWRYATAASLWLRLAKNSPYRFVDATDPEELTHVVQGHGNGSLMRIVGDSSGGAVTVETQVRHARGTKETLKITMRFTRPDGQALNIPKFREFSYGWTVTPIIPEVVQKGT